ncbi:MFS transporter [Streptomyces chrestomyceticus]|uniref:MFS transporter n=1 Tax=Streptomyces chrestomyceticus TaxID=68185 RepID=UPI003787555F
MSGRGRGVLLVLCGAIFLEGIDVAVLNVALPSIRAELGLSTGELQWVMSAYVLGYGGFMLLGGRAADLFGRRRMFLLPLAVFLVFSGLGGLAGDGWTLVLARFVTGTCAAFLMPAGLSVITTGFPAGRQRTTALLVYSGTGGGGFSVGLVVGGLLTAADWRWVFFAPVVLAALILAAGLPLIPRTEEARGTEEIRTDGAPAARTAAGQRPRLDLPGAVTVTAAILLFVLTVERATHAPPVQTLATLAASLLLLLAFVLIERRSPAPLVRPGIFRTRALVRANLTGLLFTAGFFGFQFIAVLYLRELRGWSTVRTSFAMLAMGADVVLAPLLTPRLVRRFGTARVILGGLLLAAVAYAAFLPLGMDRAYAAMFPSVLLIGVAFALVHGPLTMTATDGVAEREQGLAAGLLYTSLQFGAALGLSAATAVATAVAGAATAPGDAGLLSAYRTALLVPLLTAVLAVLLSPRERRRRRLRPLTPPKPALCGPAAPDGRGE